LPVPPVFLVCAFFDSLCPCFDLHQDQVWRPFLFPPPKLFLSPSMERSHFGPRLCSAAATQAILEKAFSTDRVAMLPLTFWAFRTLILFYPLPVHFESSPIISRYRRSGSPFVSPTSRYPRLFFFDPSFFSCYPPHSFPWIPFLSPPRSKKPPLSFPPLSVFFSIPFLSVIFPPSGNFAFDQKSRPSLVDNTPPFVPRFASPTASALALSLFLLGFLHCIVTLGLDTLYSVLYVFSHGPKFPPSLHPPNLIPRFFSRFQKKDTSFLKCAFPTQFLASRNFSCPEFCVPKNSFSHFSLHLCPPLFLLPNAYGRATSRWVITFFPEVTSVFISPFCAPPQDILPLPLFVFFRKKGPPYTESRN